MKICHVVFSSNRLEYLKKTLDSNSNLDYCGIDVEKILIDDYPINRNDNDLKVIAEKYKINKLLLNKENLGITKNWQQLFDIVNNYNYDYILHQEDDIELTEKIELKLLIEILEENKNLRQVQLKRNNWYENETEIVGPKKDDVIFRSYRYELSNKYFWMMFSLYPSWICRESIFQSTGYYPSESSISEYLNKNYNLYTALLKNNKGDAIINHFGEYSQGRRCVDGEYLKFVNLDPNRKYCSKTGREIK